MTPQEIELHLSHIASGYFMTAISIIAVCDKKILLLKTRANDGNIYALPDGFVGDESILAATHRVISSAIGGLITKIHSNIKFKPFTLGSGKSAIWFTLLVNVNLQRKKMNVVGKKLSEISTYSKNGTTLLNSLWEKIEGVSPFMEDLHANAPNVVQIKDMSLVAEKIQACYKRALACEALLALPKAAAKPDHVFKVPEVPKKGTDKAKKPSKKPASKAVYALQNEIDYRNDWCGADVHGDDIKGSSFSSRSGKKS